MLLLFTISLQAEYYDSVIGLTGIALKNGLHTIIHSTHTQSFSYGDLEDQLKITDEDPNNSNNVIEIYTGWSVPKSTYGGGSTQWNKEHTWSKSHGNFGESIPAGTDLHHLRPCDATVNSFKGNRDFDNCTITYTDSSPPSGYSGATGCSSTGSTSFEPRDADKGDVARMMFYMTVRYDGGDTSYDLELVDYVNSSPNEQPLYGKLSTLLQWHTSDPPDAWELLRNNRIQNLQGNRNPFVDHPEFVARIWGGSDAEDEVLPGVSELLLSSGYPNPFADKINIEISSKYQSTVQASIYNLRGQKIYQSTLSLPAGKITFSWDGCDAEHQESPNGLYFMVVDSGVSRLTTRFIKHR